MFRRKYTTFYVKPQRILEYAEEYGLNTVCITDHFWDEKLEGASGWYKPQNFEHISLAKPLPQKDGIRFLFGCETEMNRFNTIGVSKERFDEFDFIIVFDGGVYCAYV